MQQVILYASYSRIKGSEDVKSFLWAGKKTFPRRRISFTKKGCGMLANSGLVFRMENVEIQR